MKTSAFLDESGAQREHLFTAQQSLINWKPIIAGLFVAFVAYVTLSALGAGIFGASIANNLQEGDSARTLTGAAAIWMVLSVLVSLFAGAYFAARTSTFITGRIGAAQGLVIGSLFFVFMVYGLGKTIGVAGSGIGSLVGAASEGSANLAANPMAQDTIERALGGTTLKSEPSVVAQGLAVRLLQGNTESAKNYLSYQTGLPPSEIDARMARLETEFKATMETIGARAADAVAKAGWSLFVILSLGLGSAVMGGAMASRANFRKPLADEVKFGQMAGTSHTVVLT